MKDIQAFKKQYSPQSLVEKSEKLKRLQKSSSEHFLAEIYPMTDLEKFVVLARDTFTPEQYVDIVFSEGHGQNCHTAILNRILKSWPVQLSHVHGCARCPLKPVIRGLEDYYPEGSFGWCPVFYLISKFYASEDQNNDPDKITQTNVKKWMLPKDIKIVRAALKNWILVQKEILKRDLHNQAEAGYRIDAQPIIDYLNKHAERLIKGGL